METLSLFIRQFLDLSTKDIDFIQSKFTRKSIEKGEYLYKEGEICSEFIVITKGITRIYLIDADGKEITVWFGFANATGSDVQSFISGKPTKFFVQAIDDLEYVTISKLEFLKIAEVVPEWENFQAKFWSSCIPQIIDRLIGHLYKSAEERYETLQENAQYIQLIPQKYLASFLGITHTSLSRLRKQLYAKKH